MLCSCSLLREGGAPTQALGGHRTSHSNDRKKQPRQPEQEAAAAAAVTTTLSRRTAAPGRPAAHECSACGTTFASGQALGGHMRRHRPLTMSAAPPESVVTADDSSNSNRQANLAPASFLPKNLRGFNLF